MSCNHKEVYIVTSGEYSDYSINAVFLNKAKANKYKKVWNLVNNSYDRADIEIWEVEPTAQITTRASLEWDGSYDADRLYLTQEVNKRPLTIRCYEVQKLIVTVGRSFDFETDEDVIKSKMQKICQDIWTQVQEKIQVEGLTPCQVNEWLQGLEITDEEDAS